MGDRVILHCDLNCFFASVELLSHPDLRDIPTAVCGDPASRHGIILAKNEPAKRLGIQTAETIWQAKKKCPGLVLLPPHHGLYREYSRRVNAIYEQYTDLVEPFGMSVAACGLLPDEALQTHTGRRTKALQPARTHYHVDMFNCFEMSPCITTIPGPSPRRGNRLPSCSMPSVMSIVNAYC